MHKIRIQDFSRCKNFGKNPGSQATTLLLVVKRDKAIVTPSSDSIFDHSFLCNASFTFMTSRTLVIKRRSKVYSVLCLFTVYDAYLKPLFYEPWTFDKRSILKITLHLFKRKREKTSQQSTVTKKNRKKSNRRIELPVFQIHFVVTNSDLEFVTCFLF